VAVRSDNTTTVHIINNRRAAASLAGHLRNLLCCARKLGLELRATYLPGIQNDAADRLSRMGRLTGYHLRPEVLQKLLRDSGFHPSLDVFDREPELRLQQPADQAAEQLTPLQCVWRKWEGERLFLHPPLNRIAVTLRRLQNEPTPALLITPAWTSQHWSPSLREVADEQFHLGSYETTMETTAEFRRAGWRLPPGGVVASTVATRTTKVKRSSSDC
jgi:hypothetical protein